MAERQTQQPELRPRRADAAGAQEHLQREGWILLEGLRDESAALHLARALAQCRCPFGEEEPLALIGDYVLPPAGGAPSRDFQTLHFDFGLPVEVREARDVACLTALHVPQKVPNTTALTRLVPLKELLAGRTWPQAGELLRHWRAYGQSHGTPAADLDYVEGSFARLIDAVGARPELPSLRERPDFLCGTEFASLREELDFFSRHGLPVARIELRIGVAPGALLMFENFRFAHGRSGIRQPEELRQWVFGHRAASPAEQERLRDRFIEAFAP